MSNDKLDGKKVLRAGYTQLVSAVPLEYYDALCKYAKALEAKLSNIKDNLAEWIEQCRAQREEIAELRAVVNRASNCLNDIINELKDHGAIVYEGWIETQQVTRQAARAANDNQTKELK